MAQSMGDTGDSLVRLLLGLLLMAIATVFVLGGASTEYPEHNDPSKLGESSSYATCIGKTRFRSPLNIKRIISRPLLDYFLLLGLQEVFLAWAVDGLLFQC